MAAQTEAVFRKDLNRWVRGKGTYLDDVRLPGMCHAAFVRSPHARARIVSIDASAAMKVPGALAVLTPEELLPHLSRGGGGFELGPAYSSLTNFGGTYDRHALPKSEVVFQGEAVVAVVGETRYIAEDMADAVVVDYEPLAPVVSAQKAVEPGSPVIHKQLGGNVFFRREFLAGDVDKEFAEADLVVEHTFGWPRQTAVPLEGRGFIAQYDEGTGRFNVWSSAQGPHEVRSNFARSLNLPEASVRAVCPDVGGSFGSKGTGFPESISVGFLARKLGRPVKWVEDRRETLLTGHSHEQLDRVAAAFKKDGTLRALRVKVMLDAGAHSTAPAGASTEPSTTPLSMPGPYRLPAYYFDSYAIVTNKAPWAAYRGTGRPMGAFAMERIMDMAARALNLDPVDIRVRNFIQPHEFPYKQITGWLYDSGDYPGTMERALALADYTRLRREQAEARAAGRCVGIGISAFLESGTRGSQAYRDRGVVGRSAFDSATVEMDARGQVTLKLSGKSTGNGHETTFPKWTAEQLGIPYADVAVIQGDSDATPYGSGSGNSRSAASLGSALYKAVQDLKQHLFQIARHALHTEDEELALGGGYIFVKTDPSRRIAFRDVAGAAYNRSRTVLLPETGIEPGLSFTRTNDPNQTFANGVHIAVAQVDVETGEVKLEKYFMVDDCGTMLDEAAVEAQMVGSTGMAIGHALHEDLRHDENGQLLTATLMDYLLPKVDAIPNLQHVQTVTPSLLSLNGAKAAGEGGNVGAPVAVANAVADALAPLGVEITALPLSPNNVLTLIKEARRRANKA